MNKLDYLKEYFSVFTKLPINEQNELELNSEIREFTKGEIISHGRNDCLGIFIIIEGSLRAYMTNKSGKEITLYHLYDHDVALFTASCMMNDINFDIFIQAEDNVKTIMINKSCYAHINDIDKTLSDYTSRLLSSRFSDIMWIFEQVVFHTLDKRLAYYLLEEVNNTGSNELIMTHEKIANDLGTAREVVSRMLKYFESEKLLSLQRNKIIILNNNGLEDIADK